MLLIPKPGQNKPKTKMMEHRRAFRRPAAMMEPWDGPPSGVYRRPPIGQRFIRNGPASRAGYTTKLVTIDDRCDGVRIGRAADPGKKIFHNGAATGKMCLIDVRARRIIDDLTQGQARLPASDLTALIDRIRITAG